MVTSVIENAVKVLASLPGFSARAARRSVMKLIRSSAEIDKFSRVLEDLKHNVYFCDTCLNVADSSNVCEICTSQNRDKSMVCIVEDIEDIWNIEKTHMYNGLYHVLGGKLSAINNVTPQSLNIDLLIDRLTLSKFSEIIFANNTSPQSSTTIFYIVEKIYTSQEEGSIDKDLKISELAHGIPIGSSLEYMDEGTLIAAFKHRNNL